MGKGAKGILGGTGSYSFLRLLWDIRDECLFLIGMKIMMGLIYRIKNENTKVWEFKKIFLIAYFGIGYSDCDNFCNDIPYYNKRDWKPD